MDVLTPELHRALKFIEVVNRGGVSPTAAQVDQYAKSPVPLGEVRGSAFDNIAAISRAFASMAGPVIRSAEPVADYLMRMGWAAGSGPAIEMTLTPIGQALLNGLSAEDQSYQGESVELITLDPADPLNVSKLARVLGEAKQGMFVDPYFEPHDLQWLVTTTSINRILVGQPTKVASIAVALIAIDEDRRPEVRIDRTKLLHDRAIVAEGGQVTSVGTSLNSMSKRLTAIIKLPLAVSAAYRPHLEELWAGAEVIEPSAPPSTITE